MKRIASCFICVTNLNSSSPLFIVKRIYACVGYRIAPARPHDAIDNIKKKTFKFIKTNKYLTNKKKMRKNLSNIYINPCNLRPGQIDPENNGIG